MGYNSFEVLTENPPGYGIIHALKKMSIWQELHATFMKLVVEDLYRNLTEWREL
jgi:hypothetical protein